jgi:GT2 family glycosyltransferase
MSAVSTSVIVPTRNRHAQLAGCLSALAAAERPEGDVEVIVVNDGGALLPAWVGEAAGDLCVRVIDRRRGGPAAARNAGAAAATGALLAFTDDDCEPTPTWLAVLEKHFAHDPRSVLGGQTIPSDPENLWAAAGQLLLDHLHRWYNRDPAIGRFVTSNNLAMAATTFAEIGGFDHTFTMAAAEDRELAERAIRRGRRIVYVEDAVVRHRHRLTGRSFLRQHYNYGRGAYRLHRAIRRAGTGTTFERPQFYIDLLLAPFASRKRARALPLVALLAASQLAHTTGFAREAMAMRRS